MAKSKNPKLCVMFDTNVLFTQVASDLIRQNVKTLVTENAVHTDLDIDWHLPKVVVGERRFQMLKRAGELLPAMQKMERLLGHGFGIGEDTLSLHVDKAIEASIQELGFNVSDIDVSDVDWHELISRSVNRTPPFEDNEKEKGFRDSVIAHSFFQLYKVSPSTPNICRLALVSEDKRLREYVSELTKGSKNVRILSSLDELESLINTLVSSIPEEFAAELTDKASELFFEKENQKTFYYKQGVGDRIKEQYSEELKSSPLDGFHKNDKTWWISNPVFIKKDKSRIYWTSSVQPEFEIYHFEKSDNEDTSNILASKSDVSSARSLLSGIANQKKVVDFTARDLFEVHWSTNLSAAKNLTAAKLESIVYLGNDLADEHS